MKGFVEEPNKGTLEYTGCNDGYVRSVSDSCPSQAVRPGSSFVTTVPPHQQHTIDAQFPHSNPPSSPMHSKGRGNWLLKPARIQDGQIRFSARWKVRFSDGGTYSFLLLFYMVVWLFEKG